MGSLFQILSIVTSLVSLVCFVIILIQLFKQKGALHGILGLLCGIYTFIWGWMNADRLGKKQIMIYWTVALIAGVIFGFLSAPTATGQIEG